MADLSKVLKPCPFCGGELITIRYEGQPATAWAYSCIECGGTTSAVNVDGAESQRAVEAWNQRPA